jgi:hypothetical protein
MNLSPRVLPRKGLALALLILPALGFAGEIQLKEQDGVVFNLGFGGVTPGDLLSATPDRLPIL